MGYDAMALGSVDLGTDAPTLRERLQEADFALLSANLLPAGVLPFQPYLLREVQGHTIAFIGATAIKAKEADDILGLDVDVEKAADAIARTVEALQPQADIVIILSNLTQGTNEKMAQEIAGIDVILGSRDGASPNQVKLIEGPDGKVVLQSSGRLGQYMGLLNVHFDPEGRVVIYEGKGILLTTDYAEDPALVELLKEYRQVP